MPNLPKSGDTTIRCDQWLMLLDELNIGAFTVNLQRKITSMNYAAQALMGLNENEVKEIAEKFKESGVEAIAVSLLHSYANPEHELKIEKIIKEIWPKAIISISHQIAREFREYERTSTTVIDAYTKKNVVQYISRLNANLKDMGFAGQLLVVGPSGVIGISAAEENSLHTIASGPTGGAVGSARLAKLTGFKDLLIMDVGGTSFEVAIIKDGENIGFTPGYYNDYEKRSYVRRF